MQTVVVPNNYKESGVLYRFFEPAYGKKSAYLDCEDRLNEAIEYCENKIEKLQNRMEPNRELKMSIFQGYLSPARIWIQPRLWEGTKSVGYSQKRKDAYYKAMGARRWLKRTLDKMEDLAKGITKLPLSKKECYCLAYIFVMQDQYLRKIDSVIDFVRFGTDQLRSWTNYRHDPATNYAKKNKPIRPPKQLSEKDSWRRVIMSGHGIYHPDVPPIIVPKGLTIYFYVNEGQKLSDEFGGIVESYPKGGKILPPLEVYSEGALVENYFLGFPGNLKLQAKLQTLRNDLICVQDPGRLVPLSTLLKDSRCRRATEIHWAACRDLFDDDKHTKIFTLRRRVREIKKKRMSFFRLEKVKGTTSTLDYSTYVLGDKGKHCAKVTLRKQIKGLKPGEVKRIAKMLDK